MMQYSGKRPAQKSLLCEFRQKTAYKRSSNGTIREMIDGNLIFLLL